ncbi:penicillin-binding protein [Streptomyces agglomeratus]|uniref:Beta-lactamase n=1 Tax=Streptomyces agglomeratus TaxID=285458 RepID=A0A1E5PAC9_9ACTN|nr:serine hydrolase domain-containing protein [Streptomyces agglomeratus]OEJ26502.1 penicillin-binding protein [Streptomyces agglomeratus]OEJ51954.1 penicillin-binding protein [Streptomyces agglomeratus]
MTSRTAPATTPDAAFALRLADAVTALDAPDVVLAVTRHGRRTTVSGGNALAPPTPRHALRYELGSVSKTFTVLLLAALARSGVLNLDDPLAAHLPGGLPLRHPASRRITLRHLATHTAGLPRIPGDLIPGALLRPYTDAYATYDTERLLRTFARTRPHHRPGTRWNYSNFGVALLGPAMARATGTDCPALLTRHVLGPLGMHGTTLGPGDPGTTAVGHRRDGTTPVPGIGMGPFVAAGAVRSTPGDLLTYLEAHLDPERTPLRLPLRDVQVPQLRRGPRRRDTHTLTWFHHPAPGGPLLFHAGATFGQQAFLGFHPASGTGVAALATRRGDRLRLVETAYGLLYELAAATGSRPARVAEGRG